MNRLRKRPIARIVAAITLIVGSLAGNAQMLGHRAIDLDEWEFSKDAGSGWQTVRVPHSYNAIDGHSGGYFRGKGYYKKILGLTNEQVRHPLFLLFEGAAQASEVSVNGSEICRHKGGYTAYVVPLTGAVTSGKNGVEVTCDNHEDVELIPVHSDFNKNGGLHNPVYLLEMNDIYFSPVTNGLYRLHVATPTVSEKVATTMATTDIVNSTKRVQSVSVALSLKDERGRICYHAEEKVAIEGGKTARYNKSFGLKNPHLWNGKEDPYLYTVTIAITNSRGQKLDEVETKVGYRFYRMDAEKGFFLNGKPYPLRGVCIHQDWDGQASAVTVEHFDKDYELIDELGANFVRMAHYPHNDYAYRKCDEMGLIVQTEIPWVNVCGVNASPAYFQNIHDQMREMIVNLYNHPSIMFWGMWNELDENAIKLQGKLDASKVVAETSQLYDYAKELDPYRKVGMSDCSLFRRDGYTTLKADYYSENRYDGWYYGKFEDFSNDCREIHAKMGVCNVSEYGSGNNPFCQSLIEANIGNKDGARHYEEWANRYHESYIAQIKAMPFLNFTSLWVLCDFAVASRQEGYMDSSDGVNFVENDARKYINDKGLVTRDRKTKKDVFYLYKALWNKHQPTVYIAGCRRRKPDIGSEIAIKAYSNARSLTLYQNGIKQQSMKGSGEATGVVWKFDSVKAQTAHDVFKVVSENGVVCTW